jgi:predicted small lipoprotein YifL
MANFSNFLFSLQGDPPCFLPPRIRLPNKLTKSPTDITLEELSCCGYKGPIEVPDYDKTTQTLEWVSEKLEYKVIPLQSLNKEEETRKVKFTLNRKLTHLKNTLKKNITKEYKIAILDYIRLLESLLCKDTLCFSSIPELDFKKYTFIEDIYKDLDTFLLNIGAKGRLCYEKFGFVPEVPSELVEYFIVPSGWFKNIDHNIYFYSLDSSLERSYVPNVSGYNRLTGETNYFLSPTLEVPLLFEQVFYPND